MGTRSGYNVVEKFISYCVIDTKSDPASQSCPSTVGQTEFAAILCGQLLEMGYGDAQVDENGYLTATIPSNTRKQVPVVCFCAHLDTAPDCEGSNVKPILHEKYSGDTIVLPNDPQQRISIDDHPYLKEHIGYGIITASGTTLLGADDKSGVAIIMEFAEQLAKDPSWEHGEIKLLFTPDEEIGAGMDRLDLARLGAHVAYTLDGGEAGSYESKNFNANELTITISGTMAHPGYAKGKLVNAIKLLSEIIAALPKERWSPETTEGTEGFVHPHHIEGDASKALAKFLIRDFRMENMALHQDKLRAIAEKTIGPIAGAVYAIDIKEQYRNMKPVLDQYPDVERHALAAFQKAGLKMKKVPIRGGTDGSKLSSLGLPCPNLFTGMQAIHSKQEWIGTKDMEKAVEVLIYLAEAWAKG